MLVSHTWAGHLLQSDACALKCALLAEANEKCCVTERRVVIVVELSLYRTEMPKQRATRSQGSRPSESTSVVTRCTRSSATRTGDVPSSTQQRIRTPLTRDDIPALIQEVVRSLSRTDPHSHDDPPVGENTTGTPARPNQRYCARRSSACEPRHQ